MKMRTRLPKLGMGKGTFFDKTEAYKRGTFTAKMVYKRVRGCTSGRSISVLNFVKSLSPRDLSFRCSLQEQSIFLI